MKKPKYIFVIALLVISIKTTAQQAVGIGMITPKATFNVAEKKTVLFGKDTSGAGARMVWIPSKYAFRAGAVGPINEYINYFPDTTVWNYDSIGAFSFAGGYQNKASKIGTVALGAENNATGLYSSAIGSLNTASGNYSSAIGTFNQATGHNSSSMGYNNIASAVSSVTLGEANQAKANYSVAAGYNNFTLGAFGVAMGRDNITKSESGITLGNGNNNFARDGIVLGRGNATGSYGCFVAGMHNDSIAGNNHDTWVTTDPLFIIGNGISPAQRSNAMVMLKNGRTGFNTNSPEGQLHVKANSFGNAPTLMLEEEGNDYSRINFTNGNPGYWRVEGYSQQLLSSNALARFNFYFSLNDYIFSLKGNGDAVLTGALFQNSDERLKKNISPLRNSLSKLLELNGYTYQWKDTARGGDEQIGLLAQEVEKQFPQLVNTDENGKKSVAYASLIPVLIQAIKEQQQQLWQLHKEIDALITPSVKTK